MFFKLLKYGLRSICVCFTTLIPNNKSIWVFGAWFGKNFSDNPKYMYLYVASMDSNEITPVWITKDIIVARELNSQGINAYYYRSLMGIYYQMRAKVAFVSHGISSDLNPAFIGFNTRRVQLWHGIPLKKIGFDDHIFSTKNALAKNNPKLFSLLLNDKFDIVISSGNRCSELFSSAFNEPLRKIINTGFPRNDVFLSKPEKKFSGNAYKVIYMPTFRGERGDEFDLFELFGFNVDEIEKAFDSENIELHIRTHPANCPSAQFLSKINSCNNIKISTVDDIYEEINNFDCLVTDYSSIMFDFAISEKPILFAPFDLDNYLEADRELYYSYSDISEDNICKNWPELTEKILYIKNNMSKYKNSNQLIRSFHDDIYIEKNSFSINVFNEVKSQLGFK